MRKDLVVFVERKRIPKEFLVELEGLNRDLEDERSQPLHGLVERFNAIEGHWNVLSINNNVP